MKKGKTQLVVLYKHQAGATLLVALIMLVLITIIGFSAMQTVTMQERMSGNLRDKEISFQAAEAVLRDRENWLQEQSTLFDPITEPVDYRENGAMDLSSVYEDPEATVEEKYFIPDSLDIGFGRKQGRDLFRIEAQGRGQSEYSETELESTYAKRFH